MAKKTTLEAEEAGDAVTFDNAAVAAVGINIATHNHTVVVGSAVVTYDVDIRVGGEWIRVENGTDVPAADITVLDQVGFDAVKVTATGAGDVTLLHWKSV